MNWPRLILVAVGHIALLVGLTLLPLFKKNKVTPPLAPTVATMNFRPISSPPSREAPTVINEPPPPARPRPTPPPAVPVQQDPPKKVSKPIKPKEVTKLKPKPQEKPKTVVEPKHVPKPVPPPPPVATLPPPSAAPSAAELREKLLARNKTSAPTTKTSTTPPSPRPGPPGPTTMSGPAKNAYQSRLESSCLGPLWDRFAPNGLTRNYLATVNVIVMPDGSLVWRGFASSSSEPLVDKAIERTIRNANCNMPLPGRSKPLPLVLTFTLSP